MGRRTMAGPTTRPANNQVRSQRWSGASVAEAAAVPADFLPGIRPADPGRWWEPPFRLDVARQ
jgi:hypothetical protein